VRASELACPFCAASTVVGGLVLGAVIASTAMALSGCHAVASAQTSDEHEDPVRMTPQYGAPSYDPPPPPQPEPANRDAGPPNPPPRSRPRRHHHGG
jgi:hypothetical protein